MRNLVALLILLGSFQAMAMTDFGFEMNVVVDDKGPRFMSIIDLEEKNALTTVSVYGAELSGGKPVKMVATRIWDESSKSFLTDWKLRGLGGRAGRLDDQTLMVISIEDPQTVLKMMASAANLKIIFGVTRESDRIEDIETVGYVDYGRYCQNSDMFFELSSMERLCAK